MDNSAEKTFTISLYDSPSNRNKEVNITLVYDGIFSRLRSECVGAGKHEWFSIIVPHLLLDLRPLTDLDKKILSPNSDSGNYHGSQNRSYLIVYSPWSVRLNIKGSEEILISTLPPARWSLEDKMEYFTDELKQIGLHSVAKGDGKQIEKRPTEQEETQRWGAFIDLWVKDLREIKKPSERSKTLDFMTNLAMSDNPYLIR